MPKLDGVALIVSGETARFRRAEAAVAHLQLPPGWVRRYEYGTNVAQNLNRGVAESLKTGADHVFIMGDDHVFPTLLLFQLLGHQKDLVAPLVTYRHPPFLPIAFKARNARGLWYGIEWGDMPTTGLMEVEAMTNSGMLVHRRVFEAMPYPWFEIGQVDTQHLSEDVYFCAKARNLGFRLYVDVDMPIGHLSPVAFWPKYRGDGRWGIDMEFDPGAIVQVPMDYNFDRAACRINLGCGAYHRRGWVNVDRQPPADYVGDFFTMRFQKVAAVNMTHSLEHLSYCDAPYLLRHVRSWMLPGAVLSIEVPDMEAICRDPDSPAFNLYAYGCHAAHEIHAAGYTAATLKALCEGAGFTVVHTDTFKSEHPERTGMPCLSITGVNVA